jgi:aryl-alcohol dehydrogenase-like predicted oxidoreductase
VHAQVQALTAIAADHGRSTGELALAYLAAQPAVSSVIAGASTPEQVRQNAAGVGWALGTEVLAAVLDVVGEVPDPEVLPYRAPRTT